MTTEAVMEGVRERIGRLDERAERAVQAALALLAERGEWIRGKPETAPREEPLRFAGENLRPEEYLALSFQEKGDWLERAQEANAGWLNQKFKELDAAWLAVIDGEIVAGSEDLADYPQAEHIDQLCAEYGKFPFIFVNPRELLVEEQGLPWSGTVYPDDHYPTLSVRLASEAGSTALVADLDTGARNLFADLTPLLQQQVIRLHPQEPVQRGRHLSQRYDYLPKTLTLHLLADDSQERQVITPVHCVENWSQSPFVDINPHRQALIGRRVLLDLRPKVCLDFGTRNTQVSF